MQYAWWTFFTVHVYRGSTVPEVLFSILHHSSIWCGVLQICSAVVVCKILHHHGTWRGLDSWICSVKNISFLYVILDLGSFFQDPKIRSVWPSSVVRWSGRCPSIAVDIPRGRREHVPRGRSYFSCFARRMIFIWCAGSWFEPRAL